MFNIRLMFTEHRFRKDNLLPSKAKKTLKKLAPIFSSNYFVSSEALLCVLKFPVLKLKTVVVVLFMSDTNKLESLCKMLCLFGFSCPGIFENFPQ